MQEILCAHQLKKSEGTLVVVVVAVVVVVVAVFVVMFVCWLY